MKAKGEKDKCGQQASKRAVQQILRQRHVLGFSHGEPYLVEKFIATRRNEVEEEGT